MSAESSTSRAPDRDHYSYAHYDNPAVADGFDQLRFGGPIGQYLLETQQRLLMDAFAPLSGRRLLDVGTGTGRAALALARGGALVTGLDASAEMLRVAQRRAKEAALNVDFGIADVHALPMPDRSVDGTVCLRVLMHAVDWQRSIAELCRVTRWRVMLDFPAFGSLAALESAARHVAHRLGRRVEAYRVFREADVTHALARHGFRVAHIHRQFVLPIALHKALGALSFTRTSERMLAASGVQRLLGSPVTVIAER